MKLKNTFAMTALLAALCLGYWLMLKAEDRVNRKELELRQLFSFKASDVNFIRVDRADEKPAAAKRDTAGADWAITEPNTLIKANQVLWNRMAAVLEIIFQGRVVDTVTDDMAKYGLDEPFLVVEAGLINGEQIKLVFGDTEATQKSRYALGPDNKIVLVSTDVVFELDRSLPLLRETKLTHLTPPEIKHFEYTRLRPKEDGKGFEDTVVVVAELTDDGTWEMISPVSGPADNERINKLATEVATARGRKFVDRPESLDDYGLEIPIARITLAGDEGEPETVYFGSVDKASAEGGLYVRHASSQAVCEIDSHIITLFPLVPEAFLNKSLVTRSLKNVASLHYVRDDVEIVLEHDAETGWQFKKPAYDDIDQFAVSAFISVLKSITGTAVLGEPLTEFALDTPAVSIEFGFDDASEPSRVLVASAGPMTDKLYALQDTGNATVVSGYTLEMLTVDVFNFRNKLLFDFDTAEVVSVEMSIDNTDFVFKKSRNRWLVMKPENKVWESRSDLMAMLSALAGTQAIAIEAETLPADKAKYGLDTPRLSVTVTTQDEDGNQTTVGPMLVGKTTENNSQQRYATTSPRKELFRIPQALIDDIRESLQGLSNR